MADGDILTIDSGEPGGSGEIAGETKFKWAAPSNGLYTERLILSGTTLIPANDFVEVFGAVRQAGEMWYCTAYCTDWVAGQGLGYGQDGQAYAVLQVKEAGGEGVFLKNSDGIAHTIQWALWGRTLL